MIALLLAFLLQFPHVAMYSAAKSDGAPFVRVDGSLDSALVRLQSKYDFVILDAQIARYPQFLRYLRETNPKIKVMGYALAAWTGNWGGLSQNLYQAVVQTDGFLYCRAGSDQHVCGEYFNIDLGQASTVAAYADTFVSILKRGPFDGAFLDVWPPNMKGTTNLSLRDTIDWKRMGYASWSDFWANWNAGAWTLGARVREAMGTDYPIVGNYGPFGFRDVCAGWMRENFPFQNGGSWATNMIAYPTPAWTDPGYLTDDSLYQAPQQSWLVWEPAADGATDRRKARLTLGSASLGSGCASPCRCEWRPREFRWYPEYSVDKLGISTMDGSRKGWLGEPIGAAVRASSGLYLRQFTHGLVLVNPTSSSRSYYGADMMRTLVAPFPEYKARTSRSFTVRPNDAMFLQRVR